MVEVHIFDKSYPLCLTVAAVDEINTLCGGLNGIGAFLDGGVATVMEADGEPYVTEHEKKLEPMVINTARLLEVFIRHGENNRVICAKLNGEPVEPRQIPNGSDLREIMTIASAMKYRTSIFQAVNESMAKEIEAVYQKNAEGAEQE